MTPTLSTLKQSSWLSLVAETAGVSGTSVARVHVRSCHVCDGTSTVFVQVVDPNGRIVGAARQTTRDVELLRGVSIDLGLDLDGGFATSVQAWIERDNPDVRPRAARAPRSASVAPFDPFSPVHLTVGAAGFEGDELAA